MAELHFNGVRVVSVADGLDTGDEEAKLGIQIRGNCWRGAGGVARLSLPLGFFVAGTPGRAIHSGVGPPSQGCGHCGAAKG